MSRKAVLGADFGTDLGTILGTKPFAFGRDMKMRKTDEFSSVFRFRCLGGGGGLDVLAAPNGLTHPRLGLIIPKKVVPTAVGRNRIKRLLRELFRLHQADLIGLDVVVRLKSRLEESRLVTIFSNGLQRARDCALKRSEAECLAPTPTE